MRLKKIGWILSVCMIPLFVLAQVDQFKLNTLPKGSILRNVVAQPQMIEGKMALRIELMEEVVKSGKAGIDYGDSPTFVQLPIKIQNGTIEVEIFARRSTQAMADARAFVGLAYRIDANASSYESVYLRPLNGLKLNPPSPRDKKAVQYYAYPEWKFDRLRQEYPDGRYEAGADIRDNEWITLKLDLNENHVRVSVNNIEVMNLIETKKNPTKGSIGLWVDIGTEAWFSNLRITTSSQK